MRPNTRGNVAPGTASGQPPGTGGIRPGSGRRPPGTSSRLRTGMVNTGPGMEAAQGVALSASINVSDRPVTGQGLMGMKVQGGGQRLVQDPAYFVGQLRKKIADVAAERTRLASEIDNYASGQQQIVQLKKRHEALLKTKENLEGQLADYNLTLDKLRTATDPDDVQQMANQLAEKNRQMGTELDRLFVTRKQREGDIANMEEQVEGYYRSIQARINELEPSKLRTYKALMER